MNRSLIVLLFAILLSSLAFAALPQEDSIDIYYYPSNTGTTVYDNSTGTVYDGVAYNGVSFGDDGNPYMSFDGTDDYLNTTYSGISNTPKATISMWVYINSLTELSYAYKTPGDTIYFQLHSNGKSYFTFSSSANSGNFVTNTYFTASTWHHLVAVFDGSETGNNRMKVYVDNVSTTLTYTGSQPTTTSSYSAGTFLGDDGGAYSHLGRISNVLIFNNTALTSNEIKDVGVLGRNFYEFTPTPPSVYDYS